MYYFLVFVKVLLAELSGVAILTGLLYIYWNVMNRVK